MVDENGKIVKRQVSNFSRYAKQRPPKTSYKWIVDGGKVIGCQEDIEYFPSDDPVCNTEVPMAECGGRRTSEFVKDISACQKKLPVENAWVKSGDTYLCAAVVDIEEKGAKKGVITEFLKPEDCDHKWYDLDPTTCETTPGGRLDFHPLNQFGLDKLIPEVMNLKEKETIPAEVYKKYDSKKIALTIQYKMYKDYEESAGKKAKNPYEFLEGTAIQMAFWDKNLDSIAEKGFLNQHETITTSGCLCPENRAKAEDNMLGYKLEDAYKRDGANAVNKVRPKYSVLGFQKGDIDDSPISGTGISPTNASNYGNIIAVFNPDVKDRTTFTMTDSLGGAEASAGTKYKGLRTTRFQSDESIKNEAGSYVEAQIWGELKISDVHHFLIDCSAGSYNASLPANVIEKLKATGKDVYKCQIQKDGEGRPRRMVRGEKIPTG